MREKRSGVTATLRVKGNLRAQAYASPQVCTMKSGDSSTALAFRGKILNTQPAGAVYTFDFALYGQGFRGWGLPGLVSGQAFSLGFRVHGVGLGR